jgi:8-oxo-dGTP diphosphatase
MDRNYYDRGRRFSAGIETITGERMYKERFKLIPEAHLLLFMGNKTLLLLRKNTGYEDGKYSVVAGHFEGNETAREAMAREAKEEAGIKIDPEELVLAHITHRRHADERVSFFFTTSRWEGNPRNMEPEKCDNLSWFPVDSMPGKMVPYVRNAIEQYLKGNIYSEFGWKE